MKRSARWIFITSLFSLFLSPPLATAQTIVADPAATNSFEVDPNFAATIQSNYNTYMLPPVLPTATPDPAIAAAAALAQKQQMAAMLSAGMSALPALCGFATSTQTSVINDSMNQVLDKQYSDMSETPPQAPGHINSYNTRRIGNSANSTFAKGCSNFIDKDGNLGPWGKWAYAKIKSEPNLTDKIPDDFARLCPGLPTSDSDEDKDARSLYWVWILASVASNESGCNPHQFTPQRSASNPKGPPNGNAIGLFQLYHGSCPGQSDQVLMGERASMDCAINTLSSEMGQRDVLIAPKSTTYWGTLRGNPADVDANAAARTKSLISKYSLCNK